MMQAKPDRATKFFQLSNTETARRQALLAIEMGKETKAQVKLATRSEQRNNSILIFTIITVIFLPLSFFTSYFGDVNILTDSFSTSANFLD